MAGLSQENRGFNRITKRAEVNAAAQLRSTFVDSGVAAAMESPDHQILYGRRGTGKTHALRFLQTEAESHGDFAVYIDLRTIGSPEGLHLVDERQMLEVSRRLLVDVVGQIHDELVNFVVGDESLVDNVPLVQAVDSLDAAVREVAVSSQEIETVTDVESTSSDASELAAGLSLTSVSVSAKLGTATSQKGAQRSTTKVVTKPTLRFSSVFGPLKKVAASIGGKRLWILLDEWSSLPPRIQPVLAEFIRRCFLPISGITVKIGAIEQQSHFLAEVDDGQTIGIEVGADISANLSLDDFMVFELDSEKAREFFLGLMYRHLEAALTELGLQPPVSESAMLSTCFSDKRAFDELVRAGEGVPRDVINVAAKAAMSAGEQRITVPKVREAARSWFQTDKEGALKGREHALPLLNWIVDEVIRGKKSRGFLVNQKSTASPLLSTLFDSRVLHLVKRGYSGQDQPGERFDVYLIDYGAYVDMILTKNAPEGNFPLDQGDVFVEVPTQDLRAIRRAILDLDAFMRVNVETQPALV